MGVVLKPSELSEALITSIKIKRPAFVSGPPGVGKSRIIAATAASIGYELRDIRASLLDPVDLRGLPIVHGGRAKWAAPEWWPTNESVAAGLAKEFGVIFWDELNAAPQSTQTAAYQAILDRRLGEAVLADGWAQIAAGNRLVDRAAAQRMSRALANRFVHIEAKSDLGDWCTWAFSAGVMPMVIAFLKFRPDMLNSDPDPAAMAFCTPRSWEFVSDIMKSKPAPMVEYALIEGAVGEAAAQQAYAYFKLFRTLPNIDAILLNPAKAPVPAADDPATRWAVAFALSSRADANNWSRIITYLERMPEEYNVLAVRAAVGRDAALASTVEFNEWGTRHAAAL
jgi:hypothetical protein